MKMPESWTTAFRQSFSLNYLWVITLQSYDNAEVGILRISLLDAGNTIY